MDMLELKRKAENESSSHSILIYGDSGAGKTRMAATAALIPENPEPITPIRAMNVCALRIITTT